MACGTEGTTDFVCPEGTVRQGNECVGELGNSCNPGCASDEVCDRGSCVLDGLPNLSGFWSGSYEIYFSGACSMGSTLLYGDNIRWEVTQTRDQLQIVDQYGVTRSGSVTEDGVVFEFGGTSDNMITFGLTLDGIVGASGDRMLGLADGTLVFNDMPTEDCAALPQSFFDFRRSGPPNTIEPPNVTGTWAGPVSLHVFCPDTFRNFSVRGDATASFTTLAGGAITASFDIGGSLATTAQLDGRASETGDLRFAAGTLTGTTGSSLLSLSFDSSQGESYRGGLDGALSWNTNRVAFRLRGEARPDDGVDHTCPVQGGSMLLERQ